MKKTSFHKPKTSFKQNALRVKESIELMAFLNIHFSGKSRTAIKSMLSNKLVCVNGKPVSRFNHVLQVGDAVTVNSGQISYELKHPKVKIVFEDDYLIVIEKSEGLLAVATDEKKNETTAFSILSNYLKKKDPRNRLFVVHRIDRETSGLIMYAKTKDVQLKLQDGWHRNIDERVYIAMVEGLVEKEEDTIVSYLRESRAFKIHSSQQQTDGVEAITHYRVMRKSAHYSMLKVELETGRKNQIRVHMQEIGHPIIGDKKYGANISPIGRMGLHARVLAFNHPITKEPLRFETAIPKKFNGLIISDVEEKIVEKLRAPGNVTKKK
ncbi:MAG: RluA family pseudouridine synthase [Paludibacteraceae bacterium]|nr:RluA family pseudouridine synthase [Paludibacteraceae bacterium]MBN2787963.1 RluA family pseudouridine synthase [Paludibacteraceae bacterium]